MVTSTLFPSQVELLAMWVKIGKVRSQHETQILPLSKSNPKLWGGRGKTSRFFVEGLW